MDSSKIRSDTHAGSWYTENAKLLDEQMSTYLGGTEKSITNGTIKAIIGPHAGFDYSAPTAAWAYQYLLPQDNLKVFLLGPCHHTYLKGFGLSEMDAYKTPLGNIPLDKEKISTQAKGFKFTSKQVEEEEHSLEMHLPYIQKMLKDKQYTLVPLMIGATDPAFEAYLGQLLAKYFDQPNTLFIISSDFCHWGKRFQFTYHKKEDGEIYQSIEKLDKKAIVHIEQHDIKSYYKYLEETENTICGRHPIGVLLNIFANSTLKDLLKTKLTKYSQSGQVTKQNDSSVSYASLVTYY